LFNFRWKITETRAEVPDSFPAKEEVVSSAGEKQEKPALGLVRSLHFCSI
jgi:hypothetical protein